MDGEGVLASLSVPLRPVSYLRAVAHAMLEGEGPVVALAAEIGFDDAKLELLGHEFGLTKSTVKLWRERIDQGGVGAIDRPGKNNRYPQHGDGRAVGVPVRKALLELGGVILAQQINPLTQKTPIEGAEHCLSNYRGSLQTMGTEIRKPK